MISKNYLEFAGLFAAYVATLHMVNGPWRHWTRKGEHAAFDTWTITHFVWGGIAKRFGISGRDMFLMSILNEIVEYTLRQIRFAGLWGEPESIANIITDVLSTQLGWLFTPFYSNF